MNIFVTSIDPYQSAQWLDDKRVNKMIVESVQMLAYALDRHGSPHLPLTKKGEPYKVTGPHKNHPCTIWAGNTRANYTWLLDHLRGLCVEKYNRSGKHHVSETCISILEQMAHHIPDGSLEPFQNSSMYKTHPHTVNAYQATMIYKWDHDKRKPVWTNRDAPFWYNINRNEKQD